MRSRYLSIVACCAMIPLVDTRASVERALALKNVRVESPGSAPLDNAIVVIRNGVIQAVGVDVKIPHDALVVDAKDHVVAPAFFDSFNQAFTAERPKREAETARKVDEGLTIGMDARARSGRTPEYRAEFLLPFKEARAWREAGFADVVVVPDGSGLRGNSVAVQLKEEGLDVPRALLASDVYALMDLGIQAPSYPSTLMGVIAAYRQFFADAEHNARQWGRYEASGQQVERPELDLGFQALLAARSTGRRFVFQADSAREIRTALSLAKEFGVKPAIAGGAEAFEVIPELKAADAIVLLALDFPRPAGEEGGDGQQDHDHDFDERGVCDDCCGHEASLESGFVSLDAQQEPAKPATPAPQEKPTEPAKEKPPEAAPPAPPETKPGEDAPKPAAAEAKKPKASETPSQVIAERDARRAQRLANAKQLAEAGIPFVITGKGMKTPADLRKNLKLAIDAGLARDAAFAALTQRAAEFAGLGKALGQVAAGRLAHLAVFDGDPLSPDSNVRFLIVGDERFEFEAKKKEPADKGAGAKPASAGAIHASGTWKFSVDMGGGASEYTITFDQKDGKLSGQMQSARGSAGDLTGGTVSGDAIDFMVVLAPAGRHYEFSYVGKIAADGKSMSGTVSINGGEAHPWSATKVEGGARQADGEARKGGAR